MTEYITLKVDTDDPKRLLNLSGQYNKNLQQIEKYLDVEIRNRDNEFQIFGDLAAAEKAEIVIKELFNMTDKKGIITPAQVHLLLQKVKAAEEELNINNKFVDVSSSQAIKIKTPKNIIVPHTPNQVKYVKNILKYDINFGIGPAGTGKTYLAVACAVGALLQGQVDRIILVRPVVEAGEHLGFLPGDITQKVDPYLRPLYDALYEMLGNSKVEKFLAERIIEIAPLAFMRGRTLNSAFIILDESQNTTAEQMKMLLTRIGFGSKAVITGDITQIDLAQNRQSGLINATKILEAVSKE